MHHQLPILGHADVQLEHVAHLAGGLEDLQGVLGTLEGSSPMADAEE